MPDLVNDDMGDEILEALPAFRPFVEQRAAIEMDHRGQLAGQRGIMFADRAAAVEPAETRRILDSHLVQYRLLRKLLDAQHHPVEPDAELIRQAGNGCFR